MAKIPADAKQPTDHMTAKDEAKGKPIIIEFREETYTIDPKAIHDIEIMEWLQDNEIFKAVRRVLGAEQWAAFKDNVRDEDGRVSPEVFNEFFHKVFEALGN